MALDETENLLLQEIRKYTMVRWSRHYMKFDEHKLMNRIQYMICQEIKLGEIPANLNVAYFVPPILLFTNKPIPVVYLEAHIYAVGRYLQDKMVQSGDFRRKEHESRIKRELHDK